MNNNELQKLIESMSNKTGMKSSDIKDKISHNKAEELLQNLEQNQAQQIRNIMNNPAKTQEILNSPMAKALIKRLMNNE